jgi:tetratricopeptide (TPR) repeat protein
MEKLSLWSSSLRVPATVAVMDRVAGHRKSAYERVDSILEKDSRQLQALIVKSGFLFQDGKLDAALTAATSAVEAHPDALDAHTAVGRVQAARHQTDAAIAAYQEAVRLNPLATGAKIALAVTERSDAATEERLKSGHAVGGMSIV